MSRISSTPSFNRFSALPVVETKDLKDVRLEMTRLQKHSQDSDSRPHVEHVTTGEDIRSSESSRSQYSGLARNALADAEEEARGQVAQASQTFEEQPYNNGDQAGSSLKQEAEKNAAVMHDKPKSLKKSARKPVDHSPLSNELLLEEDTGCAEEAKPNSSVRSGQNEEGGQPDLPSQTEKPIYPEPWCHGQPVYGPGSNSWTILLKQVEKFDKEMCDGWKEDLDTMLVFTGLFSAAVTAFCIESFNSLSQAPVDTTNTLLLIISQQLSNSSTAAATSASLEPNFMPTKPNVEINVLYFASLALALSVSSICILAKQWIWEFTRDIAVSAQTSLRVRQARYDSLIAWKVPQILAALPVILQVALLLFFAGLLVQLWNINNLITAIVVTVIIFMLLCIVIFTTVLPAYCKSHGILYRTFTPFRSPQAWIFLVAWQWMHSSAIKTWNFLSNMFLHGTFQQIQPISLSSWAHFDTNFIEHERVLAYGWGTKYDGSEYLIGSSHRVLRWIYEVLHSADEVGESLLWCINDPSEGVDPGTVAHYVATKSGQSPTTTALIPYELSCRMWGHDRLNSPHGRFQTELLIRGGNQAIDNCILPSDSMWTGLQYAQGVFINYSEPEALQYQETVIVQIALLLKNFFDALSQRALPFQLDWYNIFCILTQIRLHAKRAKSQHTHDLIIDLTNKFTDIFQKCNSVTIMIDVAHEIHSWLNHWDALNVDWPYGLHLFTSLDAIMVHWCSKNYNTSSLDSWHILRTQMKETGYSFGSSLSENYFDDINGYLPTSQEIEEQFTGLKGAGPSFSEL